MSTGRIQPDHGLTARMTFTIFLIGALYVAVVAALIAAGVSAAFVIVIAAIVLFVQYWFSAKISMMAMNAHVVTPQQEPELHAIVEKLCAAANMPKPQVGIAETDIPNAFATGRSKRSAVVCATRGIMRRLDNDELEGVLAHELSHVAHRDVAVMTIASFLGVAAGMFTRFAIYSGLFGGFGGGGDDEEDNAFLIILVSMLVYAISFLLTRTLSRYRELSADRSGAILTGRPQELGSALKKITGDISRIPTSDLRTAEPFNAFFFSPAIAKGFSISSLFSTHPSLETRLAQLDRISAELGQPVSSSY